MTKIPHKDMMLREIAVATMTKIPHKDMMLRE